MKYKWLIPQPLLFTADKWRRMVAAVRRLRPIVQIHLAAVTGRLLLIFNKCRAAVHAEALSLRGLVTWLLGLTALTLALCRWHPGVPPPSPSLCIPVTPTPEAWSERQQVAPHHCFLSRRTTGAPHSSLRSPPPPAAF